MFAPPPHEARPAVQRALAHLLPPAAAENARNGLPAGLTIQPTGQGAAPSVHTSASASSDRLLSTLRGAAAAAAAEQAAEVAAGRQGATWLSRLLPGGWAGGSRRERMPLRSVEAQAARGRLTRLLVPGGRDDDLGIHAADAGYTSLPTGPPSAAPAAGFAGISSRPLRALPGQHARTGSGGPGGDALSSSLGSPSPSGSRGRGMMKAFRARMLAGAAAGGSDGGQQAAGAGNASDLGPGGGSKHAAGG